MASIEVRARGKFSFFISSSSWGRKREGGSAHFYAVGLLHTKLHTKTFSSSPPMYEIIIIFKWMKKYRHGDWWSMPNCVGPIYRTRCGQGSSMYLNRSKNETTTKNVWKMWGVLGSNYMCPVLSAVAALCIYIDCS